jgi:hypothetical protein
MVTLELVTLVSIVVAIAMSIVAWRVVRDERERSAARVTALADDIRDVDATNDLPLSPGPTSVTLMPMFASSGARPADARFLVAAMIILIGGALGAMLVLFGPWASTTATVADVVPAATQAAAHQPVPLELIALGHERDADSLIVRGVLRNPSQGVEVDALTAVVMLFNRDGGLIGTGRAAVEAAKLLPGGETAFVVTVPGASNVERYRVSFRNDDHVVPHVDQRS